MKIAVVSANVGGFDKNHLHAWQERDCTFYHYTENNLPFPLHGLSDRMKAKYIKIQTHRFIDADLFIWIDGSFQITSPAFVTFMDNNLDDYDMLMLKHPKRPNAYEEMNFLIDCLKDNEKYVSDRYKGINFEKELDYYMTQYFPVDYPLYACGFFARWNNPKINLMFDEWWRRCLEFSEFDQGLFSLEAHKHNILIEAYPFEVAEDYTKRHKHESD